MIIIKTAKKLKAELDYKALKKGLIGSIDSLVIINDTLDLCAEFIFQILWRKFFSRNIFNQFFYLFLYFLNSFFIHIWWY